MAPFLFALCRKGVPRVDQRPTNRGTASSVVPSFMAGSESNLPQNCTRFPSFLNVQNCSVVK